MGFTKRELIQFLDGLVELASEENKTKAVLAKEGTCITKCVSGKLREEFVH